MLRPGNNLRAVEQHGSASDLDYQIAQKTEAWFGRGGSDV
jgi:hypothetical protein